MKERVLQILLSFLLFGALHNIVHAQQFHVDFTKFIGGNDGDQANDGVRSINNSILITGQTSSNGSGDIPSYPAAWTNINLFVSKIDSNKQVLWSRVFGGSQMDRGSKIINCHDGGFAVLGQTASNDGSVPTNYGNDLWVIKFDSLGNVIWQKCFGGPYSEEPQSIIETQDHGFLILGISTGPGGDVPSHYGQLTFEFDWFLVKTDSLGNKKWVKTLGGSGDEDLWGSILYGNSAYYLVGASNSKDHDCISDTTWHAGAGTSEDYFILKLDTAGSRLWTKSYGGSGGDAVGDAIWDDADSSIVIVGYTNSSDFMVPPNPQNTNHSSDLFVMKADRDGNFKWGKTLGDNSEETYNMSIKKAPILNGYILGCRTTSLPTQPGHLGKDDIWMFLLDTGGVLKTNKIMGSDNYETFSSALPYKNGVVVAATGGTAFSEGINTPNHNSVNGDAIISYVDFWPLNVKEENIPEQLVVYPNPVDRSITVKIPTVEVGRVSTLIISNANGLKVFSKELNKESTVEINTEHWPVGTYIVSFMTRHHSYSSQISLVR